MIAEVRKYGWAVGLCVAAALIAPLLGWGLGMVLSAVPTALPAPPEGVVLGGLFLLLAGGAVASDRWGGRRGPWLWLTYLCVLGLISLVGWWLLRSPNAFGPHYPFSMRY